MALTYEGKDLRKVNTRQLTGDRYLMSQCSHSTNALIGKGAKCHQSHLSQWANSLNWWTKLWIPLIACKFYRLKISEQNIHCNNVCAILSFPDDPVPIMFACWFFSINSIDIHIYFKTVYIPLIYILKWCALSSIPFFFYAGGHGQYCTFIIHFVLSFTRHDFNNEDETFRLCNLLEKDFLVFLTY